MLCGVTSIDEIINCFYYLGGSIWVNHQIAGLVFLFIIMGFLFFYIFNFYKLRKQTLFIISINLLFLILSYIILTVGVISHLSCEITYIRDVYSCYLDYGNLLEPNHPEYAVFLLFILVFIFTLLVVRYLSLQKSFSENRFFYVIKKPHVIKEFYKR